MDRYSKFRSAISHKVHELKSSAADDISIISIPIKNLPRQMLLSVVKEIKVQSNA